MKLRNNLIYNFIKDFYYKNIFFRNLPHKFQDYFVETIYKGIKMKYLLYSTNEEYHVSKYLNENLLVLHKEMPGYFQGRELKEGDYVIDGGAYNGVFAIYASKIIGPKGKVICYEPDEFNVKILEKNLALNNCYNCIIVKAGLSNKEGVVKFNSGGIGARIAPDGDSFINITTLDKSLENLKIDKKKINFIKLDIEGAELDMLDGSKKTLEHNPYIAIASYHIVNGEKTCKECEKRLIKLNYSVKTGFPVHLTTCGRKNEGMTMAKAGESYFPLSIIEEE